MKVQVNLKDRWSKRDRFVTAIVEEDGAIKWESNGSYLMNDTMKTIRENGFEDFSEEATAKKRDAQIEERLAYYRKTRRGYSGEELEEMRNAFGEGTVVVNVITGEEIVL